MPPENHSNGRSDKMKIGILTFHSQLNYGGVLQCWALQTALEKLGHDVVVIDRWLEDGRDINNTAYDRCSWRQYVRFWVRSLLGLGDLNPWLRVRRTKKFLKKYFHLTPYHFIKWKDAPKDFGVDIIVVGSDQVWHVGDWGDPSVYLLEGAPKIPAIAYAASLGLSEVPMEFIDLYKRGLAKFRAISCREREGVEICKRLGFDATHVVDPTLLSFCPESTSRKARGDLVCYFLSESVDTHWQELEEFACKNKCKARVLQDCARLLPLPSKLSRIKQWLKWQIRKLLSPVRVMDSAGPKEFLAAFQNASWVVSDSFHAMMFSICNGCNVRIIRPTSEKRRRMFARIAEFAAHTEGPSVVDSVSAALDSLSKGEKVTYDYEWINRRRSESLEWLKSALTPSN